MYGLETGPVIMGYTNKVELDVCVLRPQHGGKAHFVVTNAPLCGDSKVHL